MENIEISYMLKTFELCVNGIILGVNLEIVFGSILNLENQVDCIVNAANSKLQHAGGLAGNLAQLAGAELEKECQDYIRRNTRVDTGAVIPTTAGKLNFKKILHAVGPMIENGRSLTGRDKVELSETVLNSIILADNMGYGSVAIPAISCGIFSFPKKEGAECHIQAFMKFVYSPRRGNLRKVVFSLYTEEEANCFIDALMEFINEFQYVQITELPRKQVNSNLKFCGGCSQLYEAKFFNIDVPCNEYCNFCVYRYKIRCCMKCKQDMYQNFDGLIYCRKCKVKKILNAGNKDYCCKHCNNMCEMHYNSKGACEYCENHY